MRNMDELYQEILAYIDEQGLHWIAVARHEDYRRSANWVQYSDPKDWRGFISAAKRGGARFVNVETRLLGEVASSVIGIPQEQVRAMAGKKGPIRLWWIEMRQIAIGAAYPGAAYCLTLRSELWPVDEGREIREASSHPIIGQILETPDEELVSQLLDYVQSNYPSFKEDLRNEMHKPSWSNLQLYYFRNFWESQKHLNDPAVVHLYYQHSIPELDEKVKRVERVSYLRFSEDIEKQEDAQLPAITEECALWLKQYELSKILDSDIRHFLDIKKVRLSERSFKVLKNAVIFKHRTS